MTRVKATIHGAVSLVNAIATGRGATLGIDSKVVAVVSVTEGNGIILEANNQHISSKLVNKVVEIVVPKKKLEKNKIEIHLDSEIPTGYGLKSSSAISSVVSLALHRIFKPNYTDRQVLLAGVNASIAAKVSITGAYDDACACYFGGTQITNNYERRIIRTEKTPSNLSVTIFVPRSRRRGNIRRLRSLSPVFKRAWDFARDGNYWSAMILNGYATSAILGSDPKIITRLVESGALGASVTGNGPAIAAITKKDRINDVKNVFSELDGEVLTAQINNKKADVYEL